MSCEERGEVSLSDDAATKSAGGTLSRMSEAVGRDLYVHRGEEERGRDQKAQL